MKEYIVDKDIDCSDFERNFGTFRIFSKEKKPGIFEEIDRLLKKAAMIFAYRCRFTNQFRLYRRAIFGF